MWKLDTTKISRTINEMSTDNLKEDDSIAPIYMWYRRTWTYQSMEFI